MRRPDSFTSCAAELEDSGAQGCTTTVHRHDVPTELWTMLKGNTRLTALVVFLSGALVRVVIL